MPEQAEEGTWVAAELAEFAVGDRVRVTSRSSGDVDEGVVESTSCNTGEGDPALVVRKPSGVEQCRHARYRTYEKWIPTPSGGTWVSTPSGDLRVGDRARGKHLGAGSAWTEGVVREVRPDGVRFEGNRYIYSLGREWQRWTAVTGWVEVTDYSTLNEGDTVRATPNRIGGLMQATVTTSDRYGFHARTTHVINESRNGRARDLEMYGPLGYVYGDTDGVRVWRGAGTAPDPIDTTVPEVPAIPTPAQGFLAPFVGEVFTRTWDAAGEDERPNCTVTHVARLTTPGEGWRVTYRARGVSAGEIYVLPDGTITNTSGARPGRYVRTTPTPHNPFAPTASPAPVVREVPIPESGAGAERALPEWATSLDAAKRHVHAQARRLYRRGDNCYAGSNDFANGLDLPDIGADYPVPESVDESAQIRAFLTQVREVALGVARDHGKSISLVEGWLTEQGIPPVEVRHTVTFTAPAGHNVAQAFRDLGWLVQGSPFD